MGDIYGGKGEEVGKREGEEEGEGERRRERERDFKEETEFCKGAPPLLNRYFLHVSDRKILRLRK